MFQGIIGGIVGAIAGIYNGYQQKRAADRQLALARQQYDLQQQQYEQEQQERNKANQKEADIEGLLSDNTESTSAADNLTRGKLKQVVANPLSKKSNLLGA